MEQLASLRRETRAALCAECGKCTSVCPLAACGGFSARAIACQHLDEELRGKGLGIQRCLTCAACDLRCPQGVRFTELVRGLRSVAGRAASEADCPHGGAVQAIQRLMAQGDARQDRLGWLTEDLGTHPEKGEVFFWVGCTMYYDAFFPDTGAATLDGTRAAVRVLNALGITPVVSPEERCCGHDLLWNGDRESFEALARHNVELVAGSGAEMLVTPCAECLRTWKLDYAPYFRRGMPQVLHLTELVLERRGELRLETNGDSGSPTRIRAGSAATSASTRRRGSARRRARRRAGRDAALRARGGLLRRGHLVELRPLSPSRSRSSGCARRARPAPRCW